MPVGSECDAINKEGTGIDPKKTLREVIEGKRDRKSRFGGERENYHR